MKKEELAGKKILILGYGKEGRATEKYLRKEAGGADIHILDQKTDPDYLSKMKGYDVVIKTPGINKSLVKVPYTTATNIFFANCRNMVIGITGTKGKSTTASLIHHILRAAGKKSHLIGNIGNPALEELLEPIGADDIFVMELSSYQLDDIRFSPHISVILNLFPEHMDYHGNVPAYFEAKKNIVSHAGGEDVLVYNSRYDGLRNLAKTAIYRTIPFDIVSLSNVSSSLKGEHNKDNLKAVLAVCDILHVSRDLVYKALPTFQPLPHRLEYIGTYGGIQFYDDAISTTPESTIAAINTLGSIGTLFLGGLDRGYDYTGLVDIILKMEIPSLVLFPDAGAVIKKLIMAREGKKPCMLETKDMQEGVKFGYAHTPEKTICLLSTAAPSYSVWKNFEEKGDLFKHYVKKHAEESADD